MTAVTGGLLRKRPMRDRGGGAPAGVSRDVAADGAASVPRMRSKDYGADVLGPGRRSRPAPVDVRAEVGVVVEEDETGFTGAVVALDKDVVTLEDRHGHRRVFPLVAGGFRFDGRPATLLRPRP